MLFFTNQILKAQKHINYRTYCHHVKQFIQQTQTHNVMYLFSSCSILFILNFCIVLFMFLFLFYSSHLKVCTVHSSNSFLFCERSIIGQLNIPAATAENEEQYTYSNIIYIGFQNSYSFLKFSLISSCS